MEPRWRTDNLFSLRLRGKSRVLAFRPIRPWALLRFLSCRSSPRRVACPSSAPSLLHPAVAKGAGWDCDAGSPNASPGRVRLGCRPSLRLFPRGRSALVPFSGPHSLLPVRPWRTPLLPDWVFLQRPSTDLEWWSRQSADVPPHSRLGDLPAFLASPPSFERRFPVSQIGGWSSATALSPPSQAAERTAPRFPWSARRELRVPLAARLLPGLLCRAPRRRPDSEPHPAPKGGVALLHPPKGLIRRHYRIYVKPGER